MVKRYDIECELVGDRLHTRMVNADEGDYVTYDDYQKLRAEIAALRSVVKDKVSSDTRWSESAKYWLSLAQSLIDAVPQAEETQYLEEWRLAGAKIAAAIPEGRDSDEYQEITNEEETK